MSKKNKKIVEGQIDEPQVEETTQEEIVESEPIRIDPEVFETKLFVEETDAEFEDAIDELKSLPDVTEEEPVAEVPTAIAVDAVEVDPNTGNINVKFEFQEEYFIGGGDPNAQTNIDVLPEPCCVCNEPEKTCECTEPCVEPCACDMTLPVETPFIPLLITEAPEIVDEVAKFVNDSILEELKELATSPRTIESLSREEERNFRRTGVMPK